MKYRAKIEITPETGEVFTKTLEPFRVRNGKDPEEVAMETACVRWGNLGEIFVLSVEPIHV